MIQSDWKKALRFLDLPDTQNSREFKVSKSSSAVCIHNIMRAFIYHLAIKVAVPTFLPMLKFRAIAVITAVAAGLSSFNASLIYNCLNHIGYPVQESSVVNAIAQTQFWVADRSSEVSRLLVASDVILFAQILLAK